MAATEAPWPGFESHAAFDEQVRLLRPADEVRAILVAPGPQALDATRPTRLIIFATPNGNTAEQTLGCSMTEGRDRRFDIQHVAAQLRQLRSLDTGHNLVFAVVQPNGRSWPAWRAARGGGSAAIRRIVDALAGAIPVRFTGPDGVELDLSCHSGGGSFLFGFINAAPQIPVRVRRLVFLDANYSWSDEDGHGDKVAAWLEADAGHRILFLAYDDRNITSGGKKVVGPTGGTFRATHRMLDRLGQHTDVQRDTFGAFARYASAGGRWLSLVHPNPDNHILHTRLVGDMNGLLYGLTWATPLENLWGALGEPRRYVDWIQPEPFDLKGGTR